MTTILPTVADQYLQTPVQQRHDAAFDYHDLGVMWSREIAETFIAAVCKRLCLTRAAFETIPEGELHGVEVVEIRGWRLTHEQWCRIVDMSHGCEAGLEFSL